MREHKQLLRKKKVQADSSAGLRCCSDHAVFSAYEINKRGLKLPLAEVIAKVFQEGVGKGLAKDDVSAIAKLLEQKNNVKLGK